MNTGIYAIVNTVNGKRYIGSAVKFEKRWRGHRNDLKCGGHHSRYLQAAWNKYGSNAFEFRKLIVCSQKNLIMYEQLAIDAVRPEYNIRQKAENNLGIKFSAEARARMVLSRVGNRNYFGHECSPATRLKMSEANAGRKPSAETRAKLSAARIGKPNKLSPEGRERLMAAIKNRNTDYMRTPEYRAAVSERTRGKSVGKGRKHSAETRAKMSASYTVLPRFLGRKHTDEARAKMSAKVKGIPLTPEHAAAISAALRGKEKSPEHRKRSGDAQRLLSPIEARQVRMLVAGGMIQRRVAAIFGCGQSLITSVMFHRKGY